MAKTIAAAGLDLSGMDGSGKFLDFRLGCFDSRTQLSIWGERRIAQPVMPDHSVLVGVRDSSGFERFHCRKSRFYAWLHRAKEIVRKTHATDVDADPKIFVTKEEPPETRPERRFAHDFIGKNLQSRTRALSVWSVA